MDELCFAIKASDASALERLFRSTRKNLLAYVNSITRDAATAHDVVQDVFADLWQMRRTLDPSKSVEALVYRMCRNQAYALVRTNKVRQQKRDEIRIQIDSAAPGSNNEKLDDEALEARLSAWVDELPQRQREALLLCRLQNLTHREVAEVMGLSTRTVNNHIVRALETLRQRLRAIEPSLPDE